MVATCAVKGDSLIIDAPRFVVWKTTRKHWSYSESCFGARRQTLRCPNIRGNPGPTPSHITLISSFFEEFAPAVVRKNY